MSKDVIIACDFDNAEETFDFLKLFGDIKPFIKIGMQLFYSEGPDIVMDLKSKGYKVFLDLKLHDIPNTVKRSMNVLGRLGADIYNVHAAGTNSMMKAALEGLQEGAASVRKTSPLLIAVTQLTSTSDEVMQKELMIRSSMKDVIKSYALNAKSAGLGGVVCSPLEAPMIHEVCGNDFKTVTPGIRFAGNDAEDQRRITTPYDAGILGSDYIVVGRSVTAAHDPVDAYRICLKEFHGTDNRTEEL